MAIKTLKIESLSAFEDATFELVPGINVLLGANSTGKTHALKWLYASVKALELPVLEGEAASERLLTKVPAVFASAERRIDRLVTVGGGAESGRVLVQGDEGRMLYSVHKPNALSFGGHWKSAAPTVFLPSREVLALYEGFVASYLNRELSLDETYYDACVALSASVARGERAELARTLLAPIEALLGGRVELTGNRFEVVFGDVPGLRLEAHLVAEGLRKIGTLARLIQNGSVLPHGLLIWDEPESGLNPRLVAALVPILQALATAGVQIVLATHDYLLARRLSMLSEASTSAVRPVNFFLLSRSGPSAPVEVASGPTLAELPQTPMEEEFLRLYDDEGRAFAEGRG